MKIISPHANCNFEKAKLFYQKAYWIKL